MQKAATPQTHGVRHHPSHNGAENSSRRGRSARNKRRPPPLLGVRLVFLPPEVRSFQMDAGLEASGGPARRLTRLGYQRAGAKVADTAEPSRAEQRRFGGGRFRVTARRRARRGRREQRSGSHDAARRLANTSQVGSPHRPSQQAPRSTLDNISIPASTPPHPHTPPIPHFGAHCAAEASRGPGGSSSGAGADVKRAQAQRGPPAAG